MADIADHLALEREDELPLWFQSTLKGNLKSLNFKFFHNAHQPCLFSGILFLSKYRHVPLATLKNSPKTGKNPLDPVLGSLAL